MDSDPTPPTPAPTSALTPSPLETAAPVPTHRRWRSTVAGAVTGGVLAATVAVPATWVVVRDADGTAGSDAASSSAGTQQPPTWSTSREQDPATGTDASDQASQGVVLIDTTLPGGAAAGTGLVIDSSGLVLTNYHVVEGSTTVKVTIATDGTTYDATVVGHNQEADIALLELDGASDLATVVLDDDGDPAVGDQVTAIGNAQGQGFLSASSGDVVGLDESITTTSSGAVAGERLSGLIETDVPVVGGYSGGALLDDQGEVVGITTAASSGEAQSYAVPIDDALAVADRIEAGQESDGVTIGPSAYLGIAAGPADGGVGVMQVQSDSAAARAGLAAGDTITAIDGAHVGSLARLRAVLATYEPGAQVVLGWTGSDGQQHRTTLTLGSSPTN